MIYFIAIRPPIVLPLFYSLLLFNVLSSCVLPLCHTHTYPPEVYNLLYGDLGFDDLFLPETTDEDTTSEENNTSSNMDALDLLRLSYAEENYGFIYEEIKNITADSKDAADYNEISSKLYNFTRKYSQYNHFLGKTDRYDWWWWWTHSEGTDFEHKKIKLMQKICLTLFYHARYKIEFAFKQREPIRNDKRYKLGYLFNRLRRIKTEMLKFEAVAREQYEFNNHECENLTSLMRLYERVVYFDVDIRDTTTHVINIFNKKEAMDFVNPSVTNAEGEFKVTPKMAPPMHGMPAPPGHSAQDLENDYMDDLKNKINEG